MRFGFSSIALQTAPLDDRERHRQDARPVALVDSRRAAPPARSSSSSRAQPGSASSVTGELEGDALEIGIGLPTTIPGTTGEQVIEWARRADAAGFSTLGTIDRLVYPNYEPLIALARRGGA